MVLSYGSCEGRRGCERKKMRRKREGIKIRTEVETEKASHGGPTHEDIKRHVTEAHIEIG